MPIFIQENVLGFDIPVNDALRVDVLNSQHGLNKIKFCLLFRHFPVAFHQTEQLAGWAVVEYENVERLGLNEFVHFHQQLII